jgi:hypothetical protein
MPIKSTSTPKSEVARASKQEAAMVLKATPEWRRGEDFTELYANNVIPEISLWDLKLIFGQTDQKISMNTVVQHTAITLPWAQAKMLRYILDLAIIQQEARVGRINLGKGVVAPIPERMPQELKDEGGTSEETWKALRKTYENLIAENPEAQ